MIKNLKVEKLDDFGRGISYYNDKIMFIFDALIDEVVNVEIIKETKKYYEAKVVNYIIESAKRVKPICPYFNKCGGCNLMHLDYQEQLKYKQEKVKRKLKNVEPIIYDKSTNYRNKVTLKVVDNKIGFYELNSNNIIEIDYCYLLDDRINELIKIIKEKVNLSNIKEIMIRVVNNDQMIVFSGNNISEKEILKIKDYVSSIYIFDNKYKYIYGKEKIEEKLNNIKLLISPDSFLQVNTNTCLKMYDKISNLINNCNNLLDLYCGVGSIGLYVANKCDKVLGVEINEYAINDANDNKKLNKLDNISFYNLKANEIFNKINNHFDYIIVDPPRSGLDKKTIEFINKSKANKVIYVSCDLMTLTRDINLLKDKYELQEVTPIDMFPNTYHVETIALLVLNNK